MKDKNQDKHPTVKFLKPFYEKCDKGFINLRFLPSGKNLFIPLSETDSIPEILEANRKQNSYFGVGTRVNGDGTKAGILQIPALWLDLDRKDFSSEAEWNKAKQRINEFLLKPTFIINSGGGLHVYWQLKEAALKEEIPKIENLNRCLVSFFNGDMNSAEAAHILRIPGTLNHKYTPPREVTIIESHPEKEYTPDDFDQILPPIIEQTHEESSSEKNERLSRIMECEFLKHCHRDKKTLPEPHWFAMVSILARETGGRSLIHNLSKGYPKYSAKKTDKKILHVLNTRPITCQRIKKELWKCPKNCGVKSPAALAFKDEHEKQKQVNELLSLTDGLTLFHDQFGDGYASLNKECISLHSKKIKYYLAKSMWETHGKPPSTEALNQALNVLEAQARFDNPQITLFNRIGKISDGDESFYYDLINGKALKITPNGWDICDSPILFQRFSHQKEQVTPIKEGDPWILFKHLNVKPENQLLVLVYIISCFIPNIPHPIFYPHGDHGSGKTTCSKIIKSIVDPSEIPVLSLPDEKKELVQQLNHHWMPIYDNVSSLSPWQSDLLSQVCTGGGFSKRQLYTDEDDIIYLIKRCSGLNGINISIYKPDLLDRTILLEFEGIQDDQRKEETELLAEFEKDKPLVLGGILDTLSRAITIYPTIHLPWKPRMADFARWGFSIAEVLIPGGGGKKLLESYQQNICFQNEEVIQTNTLFQSIVAFMNERKTWDGTIGELYEKLDEIAGKRDKSDHSFPRGSRLLQKYLKIIKPNLANFGITYDIGKRTEKGCPISLLKSVGKFASFASFDSSFDKNMNQNNGLRDEANHKGNMKQNNLFHGDEWETKV